MAVVVNEACVVLLSSTHSDSLVRAGFQSLQLVVADFLSFLPAVCLPFCLEVTGQYGLQGQDLNISLTSIGLLVCVCVCVCALTSENECKL